MSRRLPQTPQAPPLVVCPPLTETEQQLILNVLDRDEQLRKRHSVAVMRLKGELQALRRKGALRVGEWHSQDGDSAGDSDRACARCRAELGRIVNRGAFCRACRLRVCKACREYSLRTADWVCSVCHKHMEIQMATGEWMNEYVRRPSRRRDNRVFVPPADVVKRSIRRSWTISNPSPCWSSLRGSAELRAYSSLPRHNDHPSSESKLGPVVRRPSRGRRLPSSDTEASPRRKTTTRTTEPRSTTSRTDDVLTEMSTQQRRSFCANRDSSSGIGSDGSCPGQSPCDSLDRKEVGAVVGHWESAISDFETPGQRRSLITDGISRTSALMRQGSPGFPRRRETRVEYSGTSDSGGEKRGEPALEAGEAPMFKRVTVKRRRQDPRKIGDNGIRPRRSRDTTRCVDVNRRCLVDDPNLPDYLLETEGDDYKLVFISSDSSSKEEEFSHSDDADADSSSTSSTTSTANLTVDDCDWDYFEASSMVRPVLRDWNWHNRRSSPSVPESGQSTAEDSPLPARRPIYPARKRDAAASKSSSEQSTADGEPSTARSQFDVSRCAVCKSCGSKAQPAIALPIPVPVPASFWPSDAGLGDIVYSAQRDGDGSIRIRIRSLKSGVDGPWCLVPVQGVEGEAEGDARDVSLEMVLVKEKKDDEKTVKEDEMKVDKEVETADDVDSEKKGDRRETDNKVVASSDIEMSRGPIKLSMITQCAAPLDKGQSIGEEAPQVDHVPTPEMDHSDDDGVVLVLCRPLEDDVPETHAEFLPGEVSSATSSDSDDAKPPVERVYHFHDGDPVDEATSSEETTDEEDAADGSRFSTVFVVNGDDSDDGDLETGKEGDEDVDDEQGRALNEHVNDSDVIDAGSEAGLCTVSAGDDGPDVVCVDKGEPHHDKECDLDDGAVALESDCDNSVLEKVDCVLQMDRPDEVKVIAEADDEGSRPSSACLEDADEASDPVCQGSESEVTVQEVSKDGDLVSTDQDGSATEVGVEPSEPVQLSEIVENGDDEPGTTAFSVEDTVPENRVDETESVPSSVVESGAPFEDLSAGSTLEEESTSSPLSEDKADVSTPDQDNPLLAEQTTSCPDLVDNADDVQSPVSEITDPVAPEADALQADPESPISTDETASPATLADKTVDAIEECVDNSTCLSETPSDGARDTKTGEATEQPGGSLSVCVDQTVAQDVGGDVAVVLETVLGKKAKKKRKNAKDKVCEEVKKEQVKPCDKIPEPSRKNRKKGKGGGDSVVVVPEPQVFVDDVIAVSDVVIDECCGADEEEKKDAAGKKSKKRNKRFGKWGKRRKNKPEPEEVAESVVAEPDRPEALVDAVQVNDSVVVESATPPSENVEVETDACESILFGEENDSSCDDEDGETYKQLPSFVDRALLADPASPVERFTSLVMITQEPPPFATGVPGEVSVVTNDTTRLVDDDDVVVKHTNWEDDDVIDKAPLGGLAGYFTLTLESSPKGHTPRRPTVTKAVRDEDVVVVTGGDTMSAVVCLEEGIADDDSWVEEIEDRDDEFATTTPTDSSSGDEAVVTPCTVYGDREEELRGYHRSAIDFTLHTIVEESCEESEAEPEKRRKTRPVSASELEKYFFFGLGEGNQDGDQQREADSISECSSVYSEGAESLGGDEQGDDSQHAEDLASSRLEKYFLSGFMGFAGASNGESRDSDGSGSVGSDSEGRPSPEQRRKRLVRARGTGRQHSNSNSLDNLVAVAEVEAASPSLEVPLSEGSSTETDDVGEGFEKMDVDTVKRKKKKHRASTPEEGDDVLEDVDERIETPQPEVDVEASRAKQQSRDSGFIGSCDDLLKVPDKADKVVPPSKAVEVHNGPPAVSLTRKDSFNNWSSDEETNLMMSKMRAFFKTMVAAKPTPMSPTKPSTHKPPQLVYFENELTRLMKTVPGIRDEQVREIVEYLSSEDTWSDSYDSSDYTSSDLEGAVAFYQQTAAARTELQEQISASCQQIINKFDTTTSEEPPSKDTAVVYQRLVASFSKMSNESDVSSSPHSSPPLLAKVMHHIGSRLVALMHEVSSPKIRARRTSSASTTTSEDDELQLPRSQSHDLLLARPGLRSSSSGVSDQDERFSWRGSFESALLAGDSRTKLSAAKRRSAGDLASSNKNSREQLDRVRSCGSIGVEEKIWGRRRSSVPDANTSGASNDGDDDDDDDDELRSVTLPRSLQTSLPAGTNSLPRLPTSTSSAAMHKSTGCVKSARYRPPGFNTRPSAPKRAVSAPGLHQRRDNQRRRLQASNPTVEEKSISEESTSTPTTPSRHLHGDAEEDIDRLVAIHQQRTSLSSLGPRSDSMASVYSGAGESRYGTVAVRGEVEFSLSYNYKSSALEISVKQCRDLAAVDAKRNRSDPYVKVYLLPDKSKSGKRKTKVKKHTLNPIFDETLKFSVGLDELESRTLWLTVWHSDMFGRNDFLGEVMMSMENKVFDDPSPRFYHLNERTEPFDDLATYKGDLILALKFVPPDVTVVKKGKRSRGALHVLVKEAKNLMAVKAVGTSDPFCKCYLLPDKGRASKQKTPVARRTCNPVWNYTFVYEDVSLQELSERCLELTAWDHDRLASNEFLGGLRFSLGTGKHHGKTVDWMDAGGKELQLWQSMLQRPNFWVEGSVALRPSLEQRSSV